MGPVVFRADASPQIGTGHIMRCLALEEHLHDSGTDSVFVTSENTAFVEARLQAEGARSFKLPVRAGALNDGEQTIKLAKKLSASWIVIDGYHFHENYQKLVKGSGLSLLLVDDLGCESHYYADILLNQNIHASEALYLNRESYTQLLLGTRFVLLRREFLRWQNWRRKPPEAAKNLLVTMGGGDPANITSKVIKAIQEMKLMELNVVVVAADNLSYNKLESLTKKSEIHMQLVKNVSNMSDLMAWADIAVSAGGTSTWELAFMGLPSLLIAVADNQLQIVKELNKAGAAVNIGWHQNATLSRISEAILQLLGDSKAQSRMSKRARALVDGKGAERVITLMKRMNP